MSEEEFKQLENKLKPLNFLINTLMEIYKEEKYRDKETSDKSLNEAIRLNEKRLKIVNKLVAIKKKLDEI
jgi:arsenate reductase-like glutaredoxin family protein